MKICDSVMEKILLCLVVTLLILIQESFFKSNAYAIQVVGSSKTSSGNTHAFLWDKISGMKDLGTLDGHGYSSAGGINDLGQIVGHSAISEDGQGGRAFFWDKSTGMLDLGTLGGDYSAASAINNLGMVVGGSWISYNNARAFLWTKDTGMQNLGTLGGDYSTATGINNLGQIVGYIVFKKNILDFDHADFPRPSLSSL